MPHLYGSAPEASFDRLPVVRTRPDSLRSFAEPIVAGPQLIGERIAIAGRTRNVQRALPIGVRDKRSVQARARVAQGRVEER